MKKYNIRKDVLQHLYWSAEMTPMEIGRIYGITHERSVRKIMERYGIPRRTLSQAMTKKFKKSFSEDLVEKAYFLGMRTGDFHVKRIKKCFRIQTSTTHTAQVDMLTKAFEKYGICCKYEYKYKDHIAEWFIYVDLNSSFEFLLEKPAEIPDWIMKNNEYFFSFLAAYMDSEGNWHLSKSHDRWTRIRLRIRTMDKRTLEQIVEKLQTLGYSPIFRLEDVKGTNRGYGAFNNDFYGVTLNKKTDVIKIIKIFLPLSKHSEKVRKMKLMLNHAHGPCSEARREWDKIREEIEKEKLKE